MNKYSKDYELKLLYLSQGASIIFIVISLIAIFLTHHDIKSFKKEKTIISDEEAYQLSYINRVIIIILLIIFLYINDENRKIARYKNENIKPYTLQEIASVLTLIASLLIFYSLKISKDNPSVEVENPLL